MLEISFSNCWQISSTSSLRLFLFYKIFFLQRLNFPPKKFLHVEHCLTIYTPYTMIYYRYWMLFISATVISALRFYNEKCSFNKNVLLLLLSLTVISGTNCHKQLIKNNPSFVFVLWPIATEPVLCLWTNTEQKQFGFLESIQLQRCHSHIILIFFALFYGCYTPKRQDTHRRQHGGTPHLFGSFEIKGQPEGLGLRRIEKQPPPTPPPPL